MHNKNFKTFNTQDIMKKIFILGIALFATSVSFTQKVNQNNLKNCLGKVVTILQKCSNYETGKPIIIIDSVKYNSDNFIKLWKKLNKKTNNLESIQPNKEYEVEGDEGFGSDDPIEWRIKFITTSKVIISYYFQMGRAELRELKVAYDLSTNQYRSVFSETSSGIAEKGREESTMNIIIENNKVVKKYRS